MGKTDRVADLFEQSHSFEGGQLLVVAVAVNRCTLNEFHNQERDTLVADTAIEQARYIRVYKGCQNLALPAETVYELTQPEWDRDHLEGSLGFEGAIDATCPPHLAHAAATNSFDDLPCPVPPRVPLPSRFDPFLLGCPKQISQAATHRGIKALQRG
jgi:hypothetical protein